MLHVDLHDGIRISLNRKRRAAKLGKSPEGSSPSDCFSEDVLEREPVENVVNPSSSLEIGEASFGPFSASLRSPVLLPDVVNTPGQALQATENEIMLPWEDTEENVRSEQRNSYLPVDLSYHNEFFNSAVDPISGKTLSQIIAGKRPTRQPVAALQGRSCFQSLKSMLLTYYRVGPICLNVPFRRGI
jgi:hypothetical protein